MAITLKDPMTIHLSGEIEKENSIHGTGVITPGFLLERAGDVYQAHTAAAAGPVVLALNAPEMNLTIDDDYASGDLIFAGIFRGGDKGLAWLASGQNVTAGDVLESAGSGLLTALASGVPLARAVEDKDASSGDARIRIEAV